MSEGKLNDILKEPLSGIKELADAQTIIGDPIVTNGGTTIIPVSKVTVGCVTGGLDYNSKKTDKPVPSNFGGGGGTGVAITPVGFLIVDTEGKVDLITVANPGGDSVDKIASFIDRTPEMVDKIKALFPKKKDKKAKKAEKAETDTKEAE